MKSVAAIAITILMAASTDEQADFISRVKALEADPIDPEAFEERTALFTWLVETPDVHLSWCAGMLLEVTEENEEIGGIVLIHAILAGGVFVIEQPDQESDRSAISRAGISGALRAYEAILRTKPNWRSPLLDGFRAEGIEAVNQYISSKLPGCKND